MILFGVRDYIICFCKNRHQSCWDQNTHIHRISVLRLRGKKKEPLYIALFKRTYIFKTKLGNQMIRTETENRPLKVKMF